MTPDAPRPQSLPRNVPRPASTQGSTNTPLVTTVTSPQNTETGKDMEFHSTGSTTSQGSSISHRHNSVQSSHPRHFYSMIILRPVISDVPSFRHWLTQNFANYLSETFLDFFLKDMDYDGLIEWLDYLPYFNAQHMQQLLGPSNYDMFRGDLIALRLIWDFASNIFLDIPKITGVPYFIFLDYRGAHLEYFEANTPPGIMSIESTKPSQSENYWNVLLPKPNLTDIPQFRKWLSTYFSSWMPDYFLNSLFRDLEPDEMDTLIEFTSSFDPKKLFDDIKKENYDRFRNQIIELRLIMEFVMRIFIAHPELPIKGVPYQLFLDFREINLEYFATSTPYGYTLSDLPRRSSSSPRHVHFARSENLIRSPRSDRSNRPERPTGIQRPNRFGRSNGSNQMSDSPCGSSFHSLHRRRLRQMYYRSTPVLVPQMKEERSDEEESESGISSEEREPKSRFSPIPVQDPKSSEPFEFLPTEASLNYSNSGSPTSQSHESERFSNSGINEKLDPTHDRALQTEDVYNNAHFGGGQQPHNDVLITSTIVDEQDFQAFIQVSPTPVANCDQDAIPSPTERVLSVEKGSDSLFIHDKNEHHLDISRLPITPPNSSSPDSGNSQLNLFPNKPHTNESSETISKYFNDLSVINEEENCNKINPTILNVNEEDLEDKDDENQPCNTPIHHQEKGSTFTPDTPSVEKGSVVKSYEVDSIDQEIFYDCNWAIDFNDQDSFYDCLSVASTNSIEETVSSQEFFDCFQENHQDYCQDIKSSEVPRSAYFKVIFNEDMFFKIPLLFVKQNDILPANCCLNPAKMVPTRLKKTQPVQESVPRVRFKWNYLNQLRQ